MRLILRIGTLFQLVKLCLQVFFLLLIAVKQFSTSLVGHIAKHSVLVDFLHQLSEVIKAFLNFVPTLVFLSNDKSNVPAFVQGI